ncbi:MAG: hypothetical protein WCJ24_02055 [Candidatus Saccharibacteria bacterium]
MTTDRKKNSDTFQPDESYLEINDKLRALKVADPKTLGSIALRPAAPEKTPIYNEPVYTD